MNSSLTVIHTEEQYFAMLGALRKRYDRYKIGAKSLAIKVEVDRVYKIVGEFLPRNNLGMVAVYPRKPYDNFKIFCTLCHELGHAKSWLDGTRRREYEAAYV